ncbi:MAG: NlpC/P60 family protein [Leptolyngbyaceae cyanobacterium bins.302]|nr:NlpC/P60 family protein [Leptolyngbyaceae cyanobacterium bins.302]
MDNDSTEQTSNNESDSSVRTPDVHSSSREGNVEVHDFSFSDESSGTGTSSRIDNDSSKYSLGVDLGTDSQSRPVDSRYSLGVDTSLSGGSKSPVDHTETERLSRSNLPHSESWTSGFSPGIFEPTDPSFPLSTGEKNSNENKPAEKLPATLRDSQTTTKSRQQPSSKASNSQQLQPSEKSLLRESLDWLKSKVNSATKELESWVDNIEKFASSKSTNSLPSSKQVIISIEKLSQSANQSKVYDSANKLAENYRNRKVKYTLGAKAWDEVSKESDCSAFVQDTFIKAGKPIPINRLTTDVIKNTPSLFEKVPEGKQRAGDIILEAKYNKEEKRYKGHVGIYSGKQDARGMPLGVQMGGGGAREAPWGSKGWFAKEYGGNTEYYRLIE